jgi:F-type H+-transporting ATPase subunit b
MVTLNLTIIVEVVLFLVFLWALNRWIFSPVVEHMDSRDARLEEDRAKSVSESEQAEALEKDYARRIASINREAVLRINRELREAQQNHLRQINEFRKTEEQELAGVRAAVNRQIEAEREQFPELAAGLSRAIAGKIGLEVSDA